MAAHSLDGHSSRATSFSASVCGEGASPGWWLLLAVLAVFLTCLHLTMTKPFELATFEQLVNFWAAEPFQHRVLLPASVDVMKDILPLQARLVFALLEAGFWVALVQIAYRALVEFGIGRHALDRRLLALSVVIPMVVQLMVPDLQMHTGLTMEDGTLALGHWNMRPLFYYVYDLPAAVFTLSLMLIMLRLESSTCQLRLWLLYLGVFAIATVNRETTMFMLPATIAVFWSARGRPVGHMMALITAQAAVFVAVQWPLHRLFEYNFNPSANVTAGGMQYEHHLFENLAVLADPLYLVTFLVRFMAGFYILVLLFRRYLDARLARLLVGFALPLGVTALVMGRLVEHRIFIEMVPLVWLAAIQAVASRRSEESAPAAVRHACPRSFPSVSRFSDAVPGPH